MGKLKVKRQKLKIQIKSKKFKFGVTFIELLLVMAIVLVVGALGTTYYSRLLTQNAVTTTADQLVNQLRKAQTYAMTGKESGGVWGVKYTASPRQVTLFLNGSSGFDENYTVHNNITVTGLTQLTFGHLTGLPTPAGPTTITISGNSESESITVNTQGVASRD